jgi:diaminohydroxyphosphoribosylaminopyrimidine deaminase/5-amino-6-(5-phosphoribosylamino)uracil reductase
MREAGIEVVTGVLETEGARLNRFFFKHIQSGLPYVTLKIAQSSDGFIGQPGEQVWLTGEESRAWVHQQRAETDVVLIGANTLRVDNPQLNVRSVHGRDPHIAILAGKEPILPLQRIFSSTADRKIYIFHSIWISPSFSRPGVEWITLPADSKGRVLPRDVLHWLGNAGFNSVFVEGGAVVIQQFMAQKLWDEFHLIEAPLPLREGIKGVSKAYLKSCTCHDTLLLGQDKLRIFLSADRS